MFTTHYFCTPFLSKRVTGLHFGNSPRSGARLLRRAFVGAAIPFFLFTASAIPAPFNLLYQKNGAAAGDQLGTSVATVGDVDGDGKPDFIIGVPLASPGGLAAAGSAFIYSGATGALLYQKDGGAAGDNLGTSVAGAGDVDGDGTPDFIIGAPLASPFGLNGAGSAYVYSGATGALLYQYNGIESGDRMGFSAAGAGDVNGDGRADFIIGAFDAAPGAIGSAGSAFVYSGLTGLLIYQKDGGATNENLGYSVAGAGDVNGDGSADFIVGAWTASPGGAAGAGSAYVYSGATGGLLYQKDGGAAGDNLGVSVASAGDVDGDGRPDFIVGAWLADPGGSTNAGSAYVYSGATGSLLYQKNGPIAGSNLGVSVASAGDATGDGRADFIMGAPGAQSGAGSAYLYSGATGALLFQRNGVTVNDNLGNSVAPAGDVNGDGRSDFIIGDALARPGGLVNAGSAFLYVTDAIPPVVNCPGDTFPAASAGQCNRAVSFTATVTDNFPGAAVACTPPSGTVFPVGPAVVTCIGTDAAGNKDSCRFNITVRDTQPPIAHCPADTTWTICAPESSRAVTFAAASTDNCSGSTIACTPPPGFIFPVGSTPVTCVAVDGSGNPDTCRFSVRIVRLAKGDLNADLNLSPADVVIELNAVFLSSSYPAPFCAADMNCSGDLSPADVVLALNVIFLGSLPPC